MKRIEKIKIIKNKIREKYPKYSVQIKSSPEDINTLCVFVFNVEEKETEEIHNYIYQLQEEVDPKMNNLFLPMVKTKRITEMYYPEVKERETLISKLQRPFIVSNPGKRYEQYLLYNKKEDSFYTEQPYLNSEKEISFFEARNLYEKAKDIHEQIEVKIAEKTKKRPEYEKIIVPINPPMANLLVF